MNKQAVDYRVPVLELFRYHQQRAEQKRYEKEFADMRDKARIVTEKQKIDRLKYLKQLNQWYDKNYEEVFEGVGSAIVFVVIFVVILTVGYNVGRFFGLW